MPDPATNEPGNTDTDLGSTSGDGAGGQGAAPQDGAPGQPPQDQQDNQQGTQGQQDQGGQQGDQQGQGDEGGQQGDQGGQEIQDFTMPEGIELDTELAGELKTFAKEHGLNQDQAQKIADMGAQMLQKQQDAFNGLRKDWEAQSRQDQEFGGDKFEQNLATMNKVLGHFATPEFVQFLEESGLGQHPEMLRVWHRVAQAVDEDKLVTGAPGANSGEKTLEQRLYPNMPQ